MKCPYNRKSETFFQQWNQHSEEGEAPNKGVTLTQTVFELMDCERENCGAWHDGKCCYAVTDRR